MAGRVWLDTNVSTEVFQVDSVQVYVSCREYCNFQTTLPTANDLGQREFFPLVSLMTRQEGVPFCCQDHREFNKRPHVSIPAMSPDFKLNDSGL